MRTGKNGHFVVCCDECRFPAGVSVYESVADVRAQDVIDIYEWKGTPAGELLCHTCKPVVRLEHD